MEYQKPITEEKESFFERHMPNISYIATSRAVKVTIGALVIGATYFSGFLMGREDMRQQVISDAQQHQQMYDRSLEQMRPYEVSREALSTMPAEDLEKVVSYAATKGARNVARSDRFGSEHLNRIPNWIIR